MDESEDRDQSSSGNAKLDATNVALEATSAVAEVAGAGLEASAGCLEGCGAGCSLMVVGAVGLGFAAVRVLQILC